MELSSSRPVIPAAIGQTRSTAGACVPPGLRLYAIGDVHGRVDLLHRTLEAIEIDIQADPPASARYVFLGDYVDRGPDTRAVLDLLIDLTLYRDVTFIKGNHEACFLRFLGEPAFLDDWRQIGGFNTLISYGVSPVVRPSLQERCDLADQFCKAVPVAHHLFLRSLLPYWVCGGYCFVHAGIRPGLLMEQQSEADMLWIRKEFLDYGHPHDRIIIHGHTPVRMPELKANRINLDTGAYATGRLTALRLEDDTMTFIT